MKKSFLFALTLVLLASCTGKLNVKGTVDPALDLEGKEVVLKLDDADVSATVENNSFSIQTKATDDDRATVEFPGTRIPRFFIVPEAGTVTVELSFDEDGEYQQIIGGTPNNDLLAEFDTQVRDLMDELNEAETEYEESEVMEKYTDAVVDFLEDNINTKAGRVIFTSNHYYLSLDQLYNLFSLMDEESLSNDLISRIHENFNAKYSTSEGKQFIDFKALTPDGEELSLSDIVGKTDYVLVDFWASWCGPCRRSMPAVKELYDEAKGRLEILGVSLDDDHDNWTDAIKSLGLEWKHISDLQGWQCEAAGLYGVDAIPATVLINKSGEIVGRNLSLDKVKDIVLK